MVIPSCRPVCNTLKHLVAVLASFQLKGKVVK